MIFTNNIETTGEDICYYRAAYSPDVFDNLNIAEKKSLIELTVNELLDNIKIVYSEDMKSEIGTLSELDVLQINYDMLVNSTNPYSLNLYIFLFTVLLKRFAVRRKHYIYIEPETYFIKKIKKEENKDCTIDIIILHLMLNELLELNKAIHFENAESLDIGGLLEALSKPIFIQPVHRDFAVNEEIIPKQNYIEHYKKGGR